MGATEYTYCTPADVAQFLLKLDGFDKNSLPDDSVVTRYINQAEGEFEKRTGTAFRPVFEQHEVHDLQAWRESHRELFVNWFAVPRPIQLNHRPVLPFDSSRDHKIEVYEGSSGTIDTENPHGEWTEYVANRTQGRENDWWVDWKNGALKVRKTFLFRRANLLRISYEWGKRITLLDESGGLSNSATTITVDSTTDYQARGHIRIDNEWIFHTGKTGTTFTGCQRGARGTEAVTHDDNSEVYEVPDDVWSHAMMRAAALFLQNEEFVAVTPEGSQTSPTYADKINDWNQRWDEFRSTDYQRWGLI